MSNIIKMELQQSIRSLKSKGWSAHRISRELGVNRRTVKRYCGDSKCTNPQTGKKGPASSCEPYREQVEKWFESGLSIERIHHDLALEHGFEEWGNGVSPIFHVFRVMKGGDVGLKRAMKPI